MYVEIEIEQLGPGETALVLYAEQGLLHGAIVQHRPDGRLVRSEGHTPEDGSFMLLIWEAIHASRDDRFRVILDNGGYWPKAFPKLSRSAAAQRRGQDVAESL